MYAVNAVVGKNKYLKASSLQILSGQIFAVFVAINFAFFGNFDYVLFVFHDTK